MAEYTLEHSEVKTIRRALLIGLDCYGQIEQLINARELSEALGGQELPEDLRVRALHPTGNCEVASLFAAALAFVEQLEEMAER